MQIPAQESAGAPQPEPCIDSQGSRLLLLNFARAPIGLFDALTCLQPGDSAAVYITEGEAFRHTDVPAWAPETPARTVARGVEQAHAGCMAWIRAPIAGSATLVVCIMLHDVLCPCPCPVPALPVEQRLALVESIKLAGNAALQTGQHSAASLRYMQALAVLERTFAAPGDQATQQAIQLAQAAVASNIAAVHQAQESYARVIDAAGIALRAVPGYKKALYRRARAYLALANVKSAVRDTATLLKHHPDDKSVTKLAHAVKNAHLAAATGKDSTGIASAARAALPSPATAPDEAAQPRRQATAAAFKRAFGSGIYADRWNYANNLGGAYTPGLRRWKARLMGSSAAPASAGTGSCSCVDATRNAIGEAAFEGCISCVECSAMCSSRARCLRCLEEFDACLSRQERRLQPFASYLSPLASGCKWVIDNVLCGVCSRAWVGLLSAVNDAQARLEEVQQQESAHAHDE